MASGDSLKKKATLEHDGDDEGTGEFEVGDTHPAFSDESEAPTVIEKIPERDGMRADGKRKDRHGKWKDHVTFDGAGFDDHEGADSVSLERPDWGDWPSQDWENFWANQMALDEAKANGPEAYTAKLKALGLRNENHWERVRQTFTLHHSQDPEFMQAKANVQTRSAKR